MANRQSYQAAVCLMNNLVQAAKHAKSPEIIIALEEMRDHSPSRARRELAEHYLDMLMEIRKISLLNPNTTGVFLDIIWEASIEGEESIKKFVEENKEGDPNNVV